MAGRDVVSLCTGIGGIDLGLQRAGWRIAAQVEIDPYCTAVLSKHWPEVPRWSDLTEVDPHDLPAADLIAAGFPCQPFSKAGRRRSVADERWMWPAVAAVVGVLRPRYVLLENVAALLDDADAFGWVLSDLAALGFDAEWTVLSACAVGAPHTRERLFVVAHPDGLHGATWLGAELHRTQPLPDRGDRPGAWPDPVGGVMARATVGDGVPPRLARRLAAAGGNAAVPQVVELIGRALLAADHARGAA